MAAGDSSGSDRTVGALRKRLWLERAAWLALVGLLAALHFGLLGGGRRVTLIAADGEPVTIVGSQRDARRLLEEIKAASGLPADRVGFAQKVTFHLVPVSGNPVSSAGNAMKEMAAKLDLVVRAAAIAADGQLVVALPDQQEAVKTLSLILRELSPREGPATVYFKESVKVDMQDVPAEKFFASAPEALAKVLEESAPKAKHEVAPGDSAWKIAEKYSVSLARLAGANPNLDMERLQIGQKVTVPGELPPITVMAHREIEESVAAGGVRRTRKVRITYENGIEVKREVIGRGLPRGQPAPPAPAGAQSDPYRWRDEVRE